MLTSHYPDMISIRPLNNIKQQGVVLVLLLIFMLISTSLTISGLRTTLLEQKMVANYRDHSVAFEAAETALLEAELYMFENTVAADKFNGGCVDRFCTTNAEAPVWQQTNNWNNAFQLTDLINSVDVIEAPRYLVELLPVSSSNYQSSVLSVEYETPPPGNPRYRVTVQSKGKTTDSYVMLQSILE